jgi:hypothetical protein
LDLCRVTNDDAWSSCSRTKRRAIQIAAGS